MVDTVCPCLSVSLLSGRGFFKERFKMYCGRGFHSLRYSHSKFILSGKGFIRIMVDYERSASAQFRGMDANARFSPHIWLWQAVHGNIPDLP